MTGSPNPLNRSKAIVHLPLILLSIAFALPFLWLLASSFHTREQIGATPPKWLPERYMLERDGEQIPVTPPEAIGEAQAIVIPQAGPNKGKRLRVIPTKIIDGKIEQRIQKADQFEIVHVPVTIEKTVDKDAVYVKYWTVSKYVQDASDFTWDLVPASDITQFSAPVWRNYPEAVRALSASESDKKLSLGDLLTKSRMPWTAKHAKGKTITFLTYVMNTLVVALLTVLGTVLSSSLAAYGLSRIQWRGRNTLFMLTLATMMIPFPVLMIPLYSVFRELGWIGTLMPLWVPAFFGSAFNIFLLRQFFLTIPQELSDAARIDGCSEFGIYWRIVLPLAKPAIAVVALFQFLYSWNDFLAPMLFLPEQETYTMALGLSMYQSQHGGSEWHLLMAASVLLVLPIVILYFFTQKTFIEGIATTGVKG